MELGTALQLVVAVAMPFVLYILHGIRQDVSEMRTSLAKVATKGEVLDTRVSQCERQLHLMDPAP